MPIAQTGKEGAADIEQLVNITSRCVACSLVLLLHSIPDYVSGDWLVENDGSTVEWYFTASRFVAGDGRPTSTTSTRGNRR